MTHSNGRKTYTLSGTGGIEMTITMRDGFVGRIANKGGLSKSILIDLSEDDVSLETRMFAFFLFLHYKQFRKQR
jgi:hypothetical protein